MKEYYEAHVTMQIENTRDLEFQKSGARLAVEQRHWKFSAIDGDPTLGPGVKMYATTQFNLRIGKEEAVTRLHVMANYLERQGFTVVRRKIEQVIYDDRTGKCEGGCQECVGEFPFENGPGTYEKALEFWRNLSPEQARAKLVDMGICNPDGSLTDNYK